MREFHIGKVLYGICQEKNLEQERIYGGLCYKTTFQKIGQGKLEPGKWLADFAADAETDDGQGIIKKLLSLCDSAVSVSFGTG